MKYRGTKAADFRSIPIIAGGSSTGDCDVAQLCRARLRRAPQNGTALLVKVPRRLVPLLFRFEMRE